MLKINTTYIKVKYKKIYIHKNKYYNTGIDCNNACYWRKADQIYLVLIVDMSK